MNSTVTGIRPAPRPVPKIKPWSWAGLESLGWALVIGHVIKWAVDCWYYVISQLGWGFMTKDGRWHSYWALTRPWDHAPLYVGKFLNLFGWRVNYLFLASTDAGWVEPRHLARGVMIGLVAGVVLAFLFAKPGPLEDNDVGGLRYAVTLPLALIYAIPGIAAVGVLAYFLPWLTHHGWALPGSGVLASEVNGWFAAGAWIGTVMGLAGSQLFARFASKRPADAAGWFYAERSAAKITSETGLGKLRGNRVIGTPAHRLRVHYLIDNGIECIERSAWATRILLGAGFLIMVSAGIGAFITLAGPGAGAH